MKLQQLRYIWEVAHHNLNVSATAQSLYTSQPGISKQIRLLEDELGIEVFSRSGKHLTRITPAGEKVIEKAGEILQIVGSIKQVAQEFTNERQGEFCIATSHTQARYALPSIVNDFISQYPEVSLNMHQGTSAQVADVVASGYVDLAITSDKIDNSNNNLIMIPCYNWNRAVLVPKNHPLTRVSELTLEDIARFPIISYVSGFGKNNFLENTFRDKGMSLRVVLTATDSEVIKTYVRLGLGVGIIAEMAFDEAKDSDLACVSSSHLFRAGTAQIGLRKGGFLRSFMYDFIKSIAPHLTKEVIDKVLACQGKGEMEQLFNSLEIPCR